MSDLKLFTFPNDGKAHELPGTAVALEKSLQTLMEKNLETLLGVRFLASEYSTGPKFGGRIDTLGLDENGNPVIIEYKRATNENVINQGLFYLDWLMDHKADFKLLVMERLGAKAADALDWSAPRLLCVAGGFTRYDEHAVQQMNRNIDLIRYRRFGEELLLLELVNATSATPGTVAGGGQAGGAYKTVSQSLSQLDGPLLDLYEELRAFLLALGEDIQEKILKYYVAFKRLKNFACVEIFATKAKCLCVYVKVDPEEMEFEEGFTKDMRNVGHLGTGDLMITLKTRDDLEKAKSLLIRSYEAS